MAAAWRLGLVCALAGAALCQSPPASAQVESREGIALQNQILELRRDLQRLQSQLGQGGGTPAPAPVEAPPPVGGGDLDARLLDRVTQLEDEVRSLRGRIDEVDNARQRQGDDLAKQLGDLNFRLGNGAAAAPGPAVAAVAPPAAPPHRTPEIALQQGNAALARHDYAASEGIAREIVAGRGPRQADGQFLLAQSLAGRRDFQGAAVAYDDSYKANTHATRAPDSLLGLATSLAAAGEKPGACEILNKLRAEFPKLRPDLRTPAAAARQRAGCGA